MKRKSSHRSQAGAAEVGKKENPEPLSSLQSFSSLWSFSAFYLHPFFTPVSTPQ